MGWKHSIDLEDGIREVYNKSFYRFKKFMSKISVITVNYNDKEGLAKTIESVYGQTAKPFEFIIIDGGSTDGSKELIEKMLIKFHIG